VYDEVLSNARNTTTVGETNKSVNYTYDMDDANGIEAMDWSTGQEAYTNRFTVVVRAKVHNFSDGTMHPKNEIRIRMNECLSDQLFAFARDYHLGGTVESIIFRGSNRIYEDISNNRVQTGTLETTWSVTFQQDFNNPDIPACW
jgi:hypothetical protein